MRLRGSRRAVATTLALFMVLALQADLGALAQVTKPPRKMSPPGQLHIATVNARQNKILGVKRFQALLELAKAFRFRPPGFNGGARGAVIAPDIAVISEFRETNIEVFARLLRQKFEQPYEIVGPSDVQAALIVNTATVTVEGEVDLIPDVCLNDETSDKKRLFREYPLGRFREKSTGAKFAVAGVHFAHDYSSSGEANCLPRNIDEVRDHLATEQSATFIAGDFNFRPTKVPYECDRDERSEPAPWWVKLVTPDQGRTYVDAVRAYHRARGMSMADQWTYQHKSAVQMCNGSTGVRRSRIDYIFAADAVVAEARVDHPGWTSPANYKYSDHRYVLGRFVLTGPPRAQKVALKPDAGGVIHLTWEPVAGAHEFVVYRSKPGKQYARIGKVGAETLAFDDSGTSHDARYRYSIAAVGPQGGHGVEAAGAWATADARGPHVSSIRPGRGATGVDVDANIRVVFDEFTPASSIGPGTIALFRNGRRVAGRVVRKGGFVVKLNPADRLRKGETYTVLVRPVADVLGNFGATFKARFETQKPKRRHRRR